MESPNSNPLGLLPVTDRRTNGRFPLQEPVQYRIVDNRGPRLSGEGRTLNMSSSGLYFSTETQLPLGKTVEVSVNWPARLDDNCLLKFVATGRIVRSERERAALRIDWYEFRTRSSKPQVAKAANA